MVESENNSTGNVRKSIYFIVGSLSLAAGILGAFLPLIPTTPFVLLSAWCFLRSSDKFYQWVVSNETFGPIIENYQSGRGITHSTRIKAVVMMWLTISVSVYFFVRNIYIIGLVYLIAISVSVYLYRLPTVEE